MRSVNARMRSWGVGGSLALIWLVMLGMAAVAAPWLPFQRRQDLSNLRAAPSWAHPFGTDSRGIDMVGRVLDGARTSLLIGLVSSLLGLLLGATIGIIAGYRRGRADRGIVVLLDVFAAFPAFVAAALATLVWGQSLTNLMFVLGVLTAPVFARVTRASTLPLAERDFILASRMIGARHRRVMVRELLPNIAVPLLAYAVLVTGIVIAVEGALSFFGFGLPDRYTTWGKLIAAGQERVERSPHLSLIPSAAIVLTVLALNTVAERWQQRWLFGGVPPPRRSSPGGASRRQAAAAPVAPEAEGDDLRDESSDDPGGGGLAIEHLYTHLLTPFGPVHAVDGVDLVLQPGRLTALVGESGSGKTMLARTILGLVGTPTAPDTRGRVLYGGRDLLQLEDAPLQRIRGRRIAMIFQDPMTCLDPVLRIGRQLTEPMRLHLGLDRRAAQERALELLRSVGIPDPVRRLRAYPHELSGGLRQRVAIAIALSCDPDVLIADEPTSALDVTVQAQLLDLLDRQREERQLAVLLITHDLGVVAGRADDVAVMYAGRIVEQGATATVFHEPQHPYTAALLGAVPRLDHSSHHRLAAIPGVPPILLGRPPGCAFAPRCSRAGARCSSEDPQLVPSPADSAVACWYPSGVTLAAPR